MGRGMAAGVGQKGLKYSTLANYRNGLCMVGQFVYQTYEIDADALAMPKSPLDELLNLRAQCESRPSNSSFSSS